MNQYDMHEQIKILMDRKFFLKKQAVLFDDKNLNCIASDLRKEADVFKTMREDLEDDFKIKKRIEEMNCEVV